MKDKKDDKTQQANKIVFFPNLHQRLITRGLAELSDKNFKQAAKVFIQAREYDIENYEVNMGLLVSLVEIQQYEEARELCHELLKIGIGDYFQIMSIYLMVLLQLGEHKEMVETIELLFLENQIPFDKIEHFEKMLSFSKKVLEERETEAERNKENLERKFQQEGLFNNKSDQELLDTLTKLSQMNIRPFIDEIQHYLQQEDTHPFFKTMLLNILREQDYSQPIKVKKFSIAEFMTPSQLPDLRDQEFFKKVLGLLEKELSQNDPSLLDMTQSLLERHHFLLYPFEPEKDIASITAAYHALAEEYMTGQQISYKIAEMYDTDIQKVTESMNFLKEIEGISYPFI